MVVWHSAQTVSGTVLRAFCRPRWLSTSGGWPGLAADAPKHDFEQNLGLRVGVPQLAQVVIVRGVRLSP
jgi:hypothetical protein